MAETRSLSLRDFSITSQNTIAKAFWIVTFAVLTAIGAQLEIPHSPVPFTLQTFVVLLAGGILGSRTGSLSMVFYLLIGAAGFPVFSSGTFGFLRLIGPTGGYLLAFPLAVLVIGALLTKRQSFGWILFAMAVGLLSVFLLGTAQLWLVTGMPLREALGSGFLIFSWWDLLKLLSAAAIADQILKRTNPRV